MGSSKQENGFEMLEEKKRDKKKRGKIDKEGRNEQGRAGLGKRQ
jgi:hypothetical protein